MSDFREYPEGWAETVHKLRKKLVAPVLKTLHVLEDHDWNVDLAEKCLRLQGYGGHS